MPGAPAAAPAQVDIDDNLHDNDDNDDNDDAIEMLPEPTPTTLEVLPDGSSTVLQ